MASFQPVSHVIFDLDGLLLDTEDIYKESISKILKRYGKVYTNEVRLKVVGTKEQDTSRVLVEELKLPTSPEDFAQECFDYFKNTLSKAQLKPGAEKLICHFYKMGVPMAIATSSGKETFAIKMKNYPELISHFSHLVMGSSDSEVVNGKPAPDIFLVAAKRFKDSPAFEKCLVFEDSYNGVLAAKAANMQVVMVPESLVPEENRKIANLVLKSLEDFEPSIFGLPSFDN